MPTLALYAGTFIFMRVCVYAQWCTVLYMLPLPSCSVRILEYNATATAAATAAATATATATAAFGAWNPFHGMEFFGPEMTALMSASAGFRQEEATNTKGMNE